MPMQVVAEQHFLVGQPTVVEASAPQGRFGAVFEDDGETGYFYALETSLETIDFKMPFTSTTSRPLPIAQNRQRSR